MSNFISKNYSDEELKLYSKGEVYNEGDLSLRGSEPSTISGGLYDKRIFGSSRFCECGTSFSAGHICPICAVHIESPALLRKRFGHINLKFPYLSPYQTPTFVKLFKRIFGPYALRMEEKLTTATNLKRILITIHKYEFHLDPVEEETPFTIGGRYFKPRIEYASDNASFEVIGLSGIKLILNAVDMTDDMKQLDAILHKVLLISPASTRMYTINMIKGRPLVTLPPMTIYYKCIVYANRNLEDAINNSQNKADGISKIILIQLMIGFVFTSSPITATSKESFVRGSASTTSMKSGRATIISDHDLKVTEVSIPWKLLYHALQSDIRERLRAKGVDNPDIQYRDHTDTAEQTFQEVLSECACLMVRNPTLHKYNLTAFKPIPNNDEVIHLCPLVCNSFNADKHSMFA